MNYSALIQNRKSVREFSDKYVSFADMDAIKAYFNKARRLVPELKTELRLFGLDTRAVLEGAAGYKQFLVGAPQYMVLLSEKGPQFEENAGYLMEDLILKLTEMGLDTCWLTFTDSEYVKSALEIESELEVAAIAAFGYGVKTTKRLRLNFLSMKNVDDAAKRRYMEPKRSVSELVSLDSWGNRQGVEEYIGFYDDMLITTFLTDSLCNCAGDQIKIDALLRFGECDFYISLSHFSSSATFRSPADGKRPAGFSKNPAFRFSRRFLLLHKSLEYIRFSPRSHPVTSAVLFETLLN